MAINFLNNAIGTAATFTGVVTMTDRLVLSDSLNNSFIGEDAGLNNTTGIYNVSLGYKSLYSNTVGNRNLGLGTQSLYYNTEGDGNVALGISSLQDNTTGDYNIALGYQSLLQNTTGGYNVALGAQSLRSNTGSYNIALGISALYNNTTANSNIALGHSSLTDNTTGLQNVALGFMALGHNTTGGYNIGFGTNAGKYALDGETSNTTGEESIFIGRNTRANANGEINQIVIGGAAIGKGSNTVTLGNDNIATTYLKGDVNITGTITGVGGEFLPLSGGTLTGALTGTSATFGGNVELNGDVPILSINSTTTAVLQLSDSGAGVDLKNSSFQFVNGRLDIGGYNDANNDFKKALTLNVGHGNNQNATFTGTTTVQGTGDSSFVGNVGIGTVSPAAKLEVSSTALVSGDARYELLITEDNTASAGRGGGLAFTRQGTIFGGIKTIQNTSNNDNTTMYFQTRGAGTVANRMVIDELGNVGIGTSSPDTKLHIADSTSPIFTFERLDTTTIANEVIGQFNFKSTDSSDTGVNASIKVIKQDLPVATVPMAITFETGVSGTVDERMRITSAGNVGIGTSGPAAKLDIESSASTMLRVSATADVLGEVGGIEFSQAGTRNASIRVNRTVASGRKMDMRFYTGSNSEAMRINSSGNVGIGNTNPLFELCIGATDAPNRNGIEISTASTDAGTNIIQNYNRATSAYTPMRIAANEFSVSTGSSATERMRINSSGTIKVGPSSNSYLNIIPSNNTSSPLLQFIKTATANQHALQFVQGQQERGSIRYSQTGTSYNTASDYRLKEGLKDFKGLEMVSNIPVYNYKWKTDESRSYGVMAHELQEVLPDAVSGEKDAEEMQGVDYSKIVPLLIKSIQELTAKVERLEAK